MTVLNNYQQFRLWLDNPGNAKWLYDLDGNEQALSYVETGFPGMDLYYWRQILHHVHHDLVPPVVSPDFHTNVISSYIRGILPEDGKIASVMGHK